MGFVYILPGAHIKYSCGTYFHHGIYCGNFSYKNKLYENVVIHFQSKHKGGIIKGISYEKFAKGQKICVVKNQAVSCYPPNEVVHRAISKLNDSGYNLFSNNCEHFANWCKTGENSSEQINTKVKWVGGTVAVASLVILPELIVIGIGVGAVYTGGKFISGLFKV